MKHVMSEWRLQINNLLTRPFCLIKSCSLSFPCDNFITSTIYCFYLSVSTTGLHYSDCSDKANALCFFSLTVSWTMGLLMQPSRFLVPACSKQAKLTELTVRSNCSFFFFNQLNVGNRSWKMNGWLIRPVLCSVRATLAYWALEGLL